MFCSKSLFAIASALLAAAGVQAVCPDGWVGVGSSQLCGITTDCGGDFGAIFTNSCDIIDISWNEGFCDGGFDSGYGVDCNGDGSPSRVYTTGGDFGYCQASSENCNETNGAASEYNPINYCCQRL